MNNGNLKLMCYFILILTLKMFLWIYFQYGSNSIRWLTLYIKTLSRIPSWVLLFLIIILSKNLLTGWKEFMHKAKEKIFLIWKLMPHSLKLFVWDFLSLRMKYGLRCFALSRKIQIKDFHYLRELLKK